MNRGHELERVPLVHERPAGPPARFDGQVGDAATIALDLGDRNLLSQVVEELVGILIGADRRMAEDARSI